MLSNLPADAAIKMLVAAIKARWVCEQHTSNSRRSLDSTTSKEDPGPGYIDMP